MAPGERWERRAHPGGHLDEQPPRESYRRSREAASIAVGYGNYSREVLARRGTLGELLPCAKVHLPKRGRAVSHRGTRGIIPSSVSGPLLRRLPNCATCC